MVINVKKEKSVMMKQTTKDRPRLMRSAKRCAANAKVEKVSLIVMGGLFVVIGMMLRG